MCTLRQVLAVVLACAHLNVGMHSMWQLLRSRMRPQ
jgi:hypothetical protein